MSLLLLSVPGLLKSLLFNSEVRVRAQGFSCSRAPAVTHGGNLELQALNVHLAFPCHKAYYATGTDKYIFERVHLLHISNGSEIWRAF